MVVLRAQQRTFINDGTVGLCMVQDNLAAQASALEACCERLAREMGMTLAPATPRQPFVYGRIGTSDSERLVLEYWRADESEHLRVDKFGGQASLVLAGEMPEVARYRLDISLPPAEAASRVKSGLVSAGEVGQRIYCKMREAACSAAVLPGNDVMMSLVLTKDELNGVTAELIRTYVA